jgi:DNA-binding MarR family transcriptional regulator
MNSRVIDDSTACFVGDDGRTAILVHETDGEIFRMEGEGLTVEQVLLFRFVQENGPVSLSELRAAFDAGSRDLVKVLDRLFEGGYLYEPRPDQIAVVPDG